MHFNQYLLLQLYFTLLRIRVTVPTSCLRPEVYDQSIRLQSWPVTQETVKHDHFNSDDIRFETIQLIEDLLSKALDP